MILDIKTTKVFKQLRDSAKRISVHQGGTRSAKTYNILIWLITEALNKQENEVVTICRKTLPALKASCMRDFFEILNTLNLYDKNNHNKTDSTFQLRTTLFEFIGLDQEKKIRGRKRDKLFVNEANEINYYDWTQLIFRTTGKIILDFNPSESDHFIYDIILPRDDCDLTITTYKDNPFLEKALVQEIERLKYTDENLWNVYGLGQIGTNEAQIFSNYTVIDEMPETRYTMFGLDFGFNNPTALIEVRIIEKDIYLKERIYVRNHTIADLLEVMDKESIGKKAEIYGDSSRPESIEEIYREGYNIHSSEKGKNSVKMGIDRLKTYRIFIDKSSINLLKEFKAYKWKQDKNGNVLDEPVDAFNHGIDAARYAIYTSTNKLSTSFSDIKTDIIPNTLASEVKY